MSRSMLLRGVSVGAFAFASASVLAQEALPAIDIAAAARSEAKDKPGSSLTGAGLGGRFTGYTVDQKTPSRVGKADTPILQTPTAIHVVTRQALDDQQSTSVLNAVTANVSGVAIAGNQFYDHFIIRGFDVGRNSYRNGLRVVDTTNLETANLQSIEVLKGPAAMLYGRIEPGGLINLVPKRASFEPYYSIQEQAGSFGYTKTSLDATGPLDAEKTLAYRFNAAYLDTKSHRDFVERENIFLAPSVTWQPIEQLTFNIDGEYQKLKFSTDAFNAIPAILRSPANVPLYRVYSEPSLTLSKPNQQERLFIGYDTTLKLTDSWKVTNRFAYWNLEFVENDTINLGFDQATGILSRAQYFIPYGAQRTVSTNLDLQGRFATGPLEHEILIGGDYYEGSYSRNGFFGSTSAVPPINIWNPVYTNSSVAQLHAERPSNFDLVKEKWRGVYGQDQISFLDDRVHLLLGGRYDSATYGNGYSWESLEKAERGFRYVTASQLSPRIGLVVQPLPFVSLYANYSRSFGISNGISPDGSVLPPQAARQFEGGVKTELLDGRASASVAYYSITKTNVLTPVAGTLFSLPIGEAESNGFEFDAQGRVSDNWSLIANYSFTKALVTRDNDSSGGARNLGHRLPNVPLHSGNIWIKYDADGEFKGLAIAGGVKVVGHRQGDLGNTFDLPAYGLLNAMVSYSFAPAGLPWIKLLTAQVNVNNILDVKYYESALNRNTIVPGAPQSFLASVRAEF
jgi:iron complex outermembrane receptor protein